jgi:hypothetical protein
MYVTINQMPSDSRVWVYQSNRKLNDVEITVITDRLRNFCEQWQAHGTPLKTSFSVDHSRFIVLAVNEDVASPSGCSIDSSVHVLKGLEQELQTDFFSRGDVAFFDESGIVTHPLTSLKKLFADGTLHENSLTLNTLVQTLGEWISESKVKVSESWLKRYIPKVPVS